MPIVRLTLKIGLYCFLLRQQSVKLSGIMWTCQKDTTLHKGMMWNKNCSLQPFQPLPHTDFKPFSALVCSWHSLELGATVGSGRVCGPLPTALPPVGEATWCWGRLRGQCEEDGGWGWGTWRRMRETFPTLFFLGIWLPQALRVVGWQVSFKELMVFSFPRWIQSSFLSDFYSGLHC